MHVFTTTNDKKDKRFGLIIFEPCCLAIDRVCLKRVLLVSVLGVTYCSSLSPSLSDWSSLTTLYISSTSNCLVYPFLNNGFIHLQWKHIHEPSQTRAWKIHFFFFFRFAIWSICNSGNNRDWPLELTLSLIGSVLRPTTMCTRGNKKS